MVTASYQLLGIVLLPYGTRFLCQYALIISRKSHSMNYKCEIAALYCGDVVLSFISRQNEGLPHDTLHRECHRGENARK